MGIISEERRQLNLTVQVQATIGNCSQYVDKDGAGDKEEISVVIAPLKVVPDGERVKVIEGCNMWRSCSNLRCWYSLANRIKEKS